MEDVENEVPVVLEDTEKCTDLKSAIRQVLKNALIFDGVVRGLHEVCKRLDSGACQVVFLAESCDEPVYKQLVEALCKEHVVPLVKVESNKELGEWAGLCKHDKDGNPRKIVGASCVAVTDYGEESSGLEYLTAHIRESA